MIKEFNNKKKVSNEANASRQGGGRNTTSGGANYQRGKKFNSGLSKNISNDTTKKRPGSTSGVSRNMSKKSEGPQAVYKDSKRTTISRKAARAEKPSIKIIFLGGLNEIGKNITLFECNGDMFILDCGMAFPDGEMLGVDLVLPDFTYVEENIDKIKGIVITHGHEDHIGGLPFLLKKVNIPIYATALTVGLIENKLKEYNLLYKTKISSMKAGDSVKLGCMIVELIAVNHSIPDAVGVAIHSPAGTVIHTGDFKIDCTPINGQMINLARFAQLGNEGVLALLADSTNAERPGYTMTESRVGGSFDSLFNEAQNERIIIATFASNISRVQQIINCAEKYGRKVAFSGRSMINYITVAMKLGYINIPDGIVIDIDLLNKYPSEKIVLVTTGSQGEPMSALYRMAYSDHKKVEVGPGDFIIISANPIPGNEKTVGTVVDELLKLGCRVIYESMYEVHVSGHACQEELKIMHGIIKPKYFIPVHGEQKHLRKHAELAYQMGMDHKNVFIGDVGSVIELNENYIKQREPVKSGKVFVDGLGVGDVGSIVLRDRKHLGQDGLIIVVASIDSYDANVIAGPDIISRGFVYVRESEVLIEEIKNIATEILRDCAYDNVHEWSVIKNKIKDGVSHLIYAKTRRTPMILPIIMEV